MQLSIWIPVSGYLLLTIPDVLAVEDLEPLPTLEGGLSEEGNLDTSSLDWALANAVDHRWRHNSCTNRELLLRLENCLVHITMDMVFNWK